MKIKNIKMDLYTVVSLIITLGILILFVYIFISYGTKETNTTLPIPQNIPESGFNIPINMSLISLKSLNWGVGKNNIQSLIKFVIYKDHITTKFLFQKNTKFENIEKVDVEDIFNYQVIRIIFKDSGLTYGAVLTTDEYKKSVLEYFKNHNVPLTDKAKSLINPTTNQNVNTTKPQTTATKHTTGQYGQKVKYDLETIVTYPDFDLRFTGTSSIPGPNGAKWSMTTYNFTISKDGESQNIGWSSGAGDIGPSTFLFQGHKYWIEKIFTSTNDKLEPDEIIITKHQS